MSTLAEQIVKRHLQKISKKKWKSILGDIEAVFAGIKPSLLYDYSHMDPVQLSTMVMDLASSCYSDLMKEHLQVMSLGQDTFLANIAHLQTVLQEIHRTLGEDGGYLAVDVSAYLNQPRLLHEEALEQLKDHISDLQAQLRDSDCKLDTVLELKPKQGWNISTMFGVLLGYPVLYWYDEKCTKNVSNCLSMVPLCVYTVMCISDHLQKSSNAKPSLSSALPSRDQQHDVGDTQCTCGFLQSQHPVYNFSVPQDLVPHFKDHIDDWFKAIQERTRYELEMTCNSVTLPVVVL